MRIEHRAERLKPRSPRVSAILISYCWVDGRRAKAFRIDRLFLYSVADTASGAILFVGRVSDPRSRASETSATDALTGDLAGGAVDSAVILLSCRLFDFNSLNRAALPATIGAQLRHGAEFWIDAH